MRKLENDILNIKLKQLENILAEENIFSQRNISDDANRRTSFCFVVHSLQRFLDNYSSILDIMEDITDGPNDQDIDIFNINVEGDEININLFQVKYKTENNLNGTFGEKEVSSFLHKVESLIINAENELPLNPYLEKKYKEFLDIRKAKKNKISHIKVNLYFATNGEDLNQQEKEMLKKFKKKYSNVGNTEVLNSYEFFIDNKEEKNGVIHIPISCEPINMNADINAKVVNIRAYDVAELYATFEERILEKNVRKLLKGKTNKEIADSLKSDPKMFWYKNNGLSIVCKRMEVKTLGGERSIELENPYIVNGGQTTKTIYNYFKTLDKDNQVDMKPFYDAQIMARIYQTTDDEKISQIVYGTNSQNKITS